MNKEDIIFLRKEILTNCKDILNLYLKNKALLYHGRAKNDDYLIFNRIQNRKPKDISIHYHNMINRALDSLGFKTNRSNALFCISDYKTAKDYAAFGKTYVVFPYDGFSYLWSPHINDLIENIEEIMENISQEVDEEIEKRSFFVTGSIKFGYNIDGKYIIPENNEKFFLMDLEQVLLKKYYSVFEVFKDHPDLFNFTNIKSKKQAEQLKQILENNCYKITDEEKYYDFLFHEHLKEYLKSLYKDTDLDSALKIPVEVMINAEKFILIDSYFIPNFKELKKFLNI